MPLSRLRLFYIAAAAVVAACTGLTEEARAELESVFPTSFSDLGCLRDIKTLRKLCAAIGVYRQQHPVALALLLSYVYLLYQAFPLFMFPFSGTTRPHTEALIAKSLGHKHVFAGKARCSCPLCCFLLSKYRFCSVMGLEFQFLWLWLSFCCFNDSTEPQRALLDC